MEAAVSVSVGSVGAVLEKLNYLTTVCSSIIGVRKQVVFLHSELSAMHAQLLKVAAMEEEGPVDVQVKAWARDVRETSYDVEDCVDALTLGLRLAGAGGGGQGRGGGIVMDFFRKCAEFLKMLRVCHQFSGKINDLKARVVEVGERRERYKLDDLARCDSGDLAVDPRLPALFAEEDHLVGMHGPIDELVRWLLEVEGRLRVLAIVGFGGLGKTTLATQVSGKIKGGFLCKAFVSVSQRPNLKKVMRDCMKQLLQGCEFEDDVETWDLTRIIAETREYLRHRRYLIVIDDIWSIYAWETVKCAFPENTCGSKIIITTRITDVAGSCVSCLDGRIYRIEALNSHHSKQLFLRRCQDPFPDVSDKILEKCGGLPLAIISISGLLANKAAAKEEWVKVRNSIGSDLEKDKNLNAILNLSYSDLPHHLKTCLLYLTVFPEDYLIKRDRLVKRWIAEGFVSPKRGRSLQDVAESYFYELINRSMVRPENVGYDGKARACTIHDIILELIISKATEENFITIVGSQASVVYPQCNIRRLSIQQADQEDSSGLGEKDVSHARSLTAFGVVKHVPRLVLFEALRVLDFERCMDLEEYDLNSIEKLAQLRFLSLRDSFISQVPPGIAKLFDLETLDLRGTEVVELPAGIVHLTRLKHLLTGDHARGKTKLPDRVGNMASLQVLVGFDVILSSAAAVEELSKLTSLKELCIQLNAEGSGRNKRHEEVLLSSLCTLGSCRLHSLWICSSNSTPMEFLDSWSPLPLSLQRFRVSSNFFYLKIPTWISPALANLAYLNINLVEVTEEDLGMLGELQALIHLELWFKADPKERIVVRRGGFRYLKEFSYIRCPITCWGEGYLVFENEALPKVEKLNLPFSVSVAKCYEFQLGIEHLPCLKSAQVILGKDGATPDESNAAAAAVRNEANAHPNHPKVTIVGEE
uniref:NB-ARC domain-containing protein n=1 Tax=Arundo donax TaxID=35708 RepID=A0A0A9CNK3_ARUDO